MYTFIYNDIIIEIDVMRDFDVKNSTVVPSVFCLTKLRRSYGIDTIDDELEEALVSSAYLHMGEIANKYMSTLAARMDEEESVNCNYTLGD